jgi:hypothetical protein
MAYRVIGTGSTVGNSVGYGYYTALTGFDTCWSFYNDSATAHNLLGKDNVKSYIGTGLDASLYYDGTNLVINPKEVGSGFLSVLGSAKIGDGTNQAIIATDGEITLEGTARVYKVVALRPSGFQVPGTKPATSVEHGISMAWEFSDGTDDTIEAEMQLPQDMDRTVAPEFNIGWDSDTADPGDDTKQCVWQLEYLYLSLNEDVTAVAQETLTVTTSASTTTNGLVVSTITGLDLPSATDRFMLIRLKRLGADGDDDLSDVAYLNGCGFKYTSNKLGVAL